MAVEWKKILLPQDASLRPVSFKFGAEGSTTTSSTYVTVANSDIALNPANFAEGGALYVKFIFHIKCTGTAVNGYIQVLRQNAATAVTGSEKYGGAGATWEILETAWIDWSAESGNESYQIQLHSDGIETVEFNSAIMILSHIAY